MNSPTHTILVVEDEAPIRKFISKILEMHPYKVLEAGHGEEALAVSEAHPGRIDLLITDIMMPVMNGRELAVRLSSLRPGVGILFISGYPGKYIPEGLGHDASVDYLAKPFGPNSLLAKIDELLGKGRLTFPAS